MYFKIDEDDRIILCPNDEKDLEKLERVYHKMKHKGLEQIEIVLELPKEDSNKQYYSQEEQQRRQQQEQQGQEFGFDPNRNRPRGVGDHLDVYSHYPYIPGVLPPFWFERYGYNQARSPETSPGYNPAHPSQDDFPYGPVQQPRGNPH